LPSFPTRRSSDLAEKQSQPEQAGLRQEDVGEQECRARPKFRITQKTKTPRHGGESDRDRGARVPIVVRMHPASDREDGEELYFETEENYGSCVRFRNGKEFIGPGEFHQDRAGGSEEDEIIPAFAERDRGNADVQNRYVTEERRRIILARGEQHGGKKSAQEAKDHNHLGVQANGEEEGGGGDESHGNEGRNQLDQMIENVRRKNVAIENENASGAEALARDAITARSG